MAGANPEDGGRGPIVVGVDGSQASKDALAWALRLARSAGSRLKVVTAWEVPALAYGTGVLLPSGLDYSSAAAETLDEAVREVLGDPPAVEVEKVVVEGHPAPRLVELAAGAELLVVGGRGHGAFSGMLLGSVSAHCASHAPCPVVIVRHAAERG